MRLEVKYAPKVKVTVRAASGTAAAPSASLISGGIAGAGATSGAFLGAGAASGRIAEGADVRVSCRSDANPAEVTYRWYINEELVVGDYTTELVSCCSFSFSSLRWRLFSAAA